MPEQTLNGLYICMYVFNRLLLSHPWSSHTFCPTEFLNFFADTEQRFFSIITYLRKLIHAYSYIHTIVHLFCIFSQFLSFSIQLCAYLPPIRFSFTLRQMHCFLPAFISLACLFQSYSAEELIHVRAHLRHGLIKILTPR